jgi:hypothetical protein
LLSAENTSHENLRTSNRATKPQERDRVVGKIKGAAETGRTETSGARRPAMESGGRWRGMVDRRLGCSTYRTGNLLAPGASTFVAVSRSVQRFFLRRHKRKSQARPGIRCNGQEKDPSAPVKRPCFTCPY